MADTVEILRLMNHAADRLEAEKVGIYDAFASQQRSGEPALLGLSSAMSAVALATATLRLVATFMTEADSQQEDHSG